MASTSYMHLPRDQRLTSHRRFIDLNLVAICIAIFGALIDKSQGAQVMAIALGAIGVIGVFLGGFALLYENNRSVFVTELKRRSAGTSTDQWKSFGDVNPPAAEIAARTAGLLVGSDHVSSAVALLNMQGTKEPSSVHFSIQYPDGRLELREAPKELSTWAMRKFPSPMELGRDWRLALVCTAHGVTTVSMLNEDQYTALISSAGLNAEVLRRFHPLPSATGPRTATAAVPADA
ncbi:hypothetical protein [Arthrobacter sp. UYCo732]|uniref:hypothetical protein n=1 Tax=Arthrobacter sp. UYCo732 TaxID=3156336 RepID=UPI003394991B